MAWKIKFIPNIEKQLKKIPKNEIKRIFNYLREKVTTNPRAYGKPLKGQFNEFWRYRIGNYRVIVKLEDEELVVLVVRVAHRKDVYKEKL